MDAWFQRACAREPADRFDTAEELTAAFAVAAGLRAAPSSAGPEPAPRIAAPATPSGLRTAGASQSAPGVEPAPEINAPSGHTAAPFSVTEHGIPKRSLAVPLAVAGAVVLLGGAFVATRLMRTPAAEPSSAATSSAVTAPATETAAVPPPRAAPEAPSVAPPSAPPAHAPHLDVSATGAPAAVSAKPAEPSAAAGHPARPNRPTAAAASQAAVHKPAAAPSAPARPPAAPKPSQVDLGF
jgi:hypothetical protein